MRVFVFLAQMHKPHWWPRRSPRAPGGREMMWSLKRRRLMIAAALQLPADNTADMMRAAFVRVAGRATGFGRGLLSVQLRASMIVDAQLRGLAADSLHGGLAHALAARLPRTRSSRFAIGHQPSRAPVARLTAPPSFFLLVHVTLQSHTPTPIHSDLPSRYPCCCTSSM